MDKLLYIISFFIYSGYYSILAISMKIGLNYNTRIVTIPFRLLLSMGMFSIFFIQLKKGISNSKKGYVSLFILFWFIYFIKITHNVINGVPLNSSVLEYFFYAISFCVLPFLSFSKIDFKSQKEIVFKGLFDSSLLFSVIALTLYKEFFFSNVTRVSELKYVDESYAFFVSPHAVSFGGVILISLSLFKILINKSKKLLFKFSSFLGCLMLMMGASRSAVIALVLIILVLVIKIAKKNFFKVLPIFFLSIYGIIRFANNSNSGIFERFKLIEDNIDSDYEHSRTVLWRKSINEFIDFPILGNRIEIDFYPHNFIIETLMATGFIGFLILLIFLVHIFLIIKKSINKNPDTLWVYFIFIIGFVNSFFTGALYTSIILFFSCGLIYSINNFKSINSFR